MDENTWRFAQLIMWLMGIQTTFLAALMGIIWNNLNKKIEKIEQKLEEKIELINTRVTDMDKRLFGIETMLHMKDCCMLKDERQTLKKVE